MNETKLMIFIHKILENSSATKAERTLRQLREILKEQKVSKHLIDLVIMTLDSIPEAKEISKTEMISANNIRIAKQRADKRREQERMMHSYRGCR